MLLQNGELKEQLAELQDGFIKLTGNNLELTSTLQSEQYIKKELAKVVGQLLETLRDMHETVKVKSQEAVDLQEQGDQCLATCSNTWPSTSTWLHQQLLRQTQLS
jgi:hypothetical protein